MANEKIRREINKAGLFQWMVADCLGISEITFSRMLRHELTDDQQQRVLNAIEQAKANKEDQK